MGMHIGSGQASLDVDLNLSFNFHFFLISFMLYSLAVFVAVLEILFLITMRPTVFKFTKNWAKLTPKYNFSSKDSKELDLIKNQALHVLAQHRSILQRINEEHYTQKCPAFYNASVGGHVRHAVD